MKAKGGTGLAHHQSISRSDQILSCRETLAQVDLAQLNLEIQGCRLITERFGICHYRVDRLKLGCREGSTKSQLLQTHVDAITRLHMALFKRKRLTGTNLC